MCEAYFMFIRVVSFSKIREKITQLWLVILVIKQLFLNSNNIEYFFASKYPYLIRYIAETKYVTRKWLKPILTYRKVSIKK